MYNGATFRVKGNVRILDNVKASIATGATSNNTYLAGSSVIEVIGELGENALIHITPVPDRTTPYVTFAEGVSTTNALSHFVLDDDEYRLILVNNQIEAY